MTWHLTYGDVLWSFFTENIKKLPNIELKTIRLFTSTLSSNSYTHCTDRTHKMSVRLEMGKGRTRSGGTIL